MGLVPVLRETTAISCRQACKLDLTPELCAGVAPNGKQSPSSYAGAEQEMQPRKLSNA